MKFYALAYVRRPLTAALALAFAVPMAGCVAATAAGLMVESYRRTGTRSVAAEYEGLAGKSFAVIISADRIIQSEHPQLVPKLTNAITARLAGSIPDSRPRSPIDVLQFQYNTPRWPALTFSELAERLGVERVVFVDLFDYRLYETGNSYLWDGMLAGQVGIIESDGPLPDDFAFTSGVAVRFPDSPGYTPAEFNAQQIAAVLQSRFVDRSTWLFYEHEEPYYPDY